MKDTVNPQTPAIELIKITKNFTNFVALKETSMEIAQGEFFSMLGPSGCGKTTTLRMIAGFETPSSGRIRLLGQDIHNRPAHRRPVNMVFQSYALFPHLNVFENVAFGLRVERTPTPELRMRVKRALEMVQLTGRENRKPAQLSGGQQQRVALARALVKEPAVLLLDEPLGALDQKLRKEMQLELKRLQREIGITFIYVTHDQEEALTMSDRIAVMNQGQVLQIASPTVIYEQPATRFVADFIGLSNFLEGHFVSVDNDLATIEIEGLGGVRTKTSQPIEANARITLAIRPERMRLAKKTDGVEENAVKGTVEEVIFVGNDTQYFIRIANNSRILVREQNQEPSSETTPIQVGRAVTVYWSPGSTSVLFE